MAPGRICFAPSRARSLTINVVSDTLVASTNLKRDSGNTDDSTCDWVQLKGVNILLVST